MNTRALLLAVAVAAAVILASLYARPASGGFVGALARVPAMQNCLAYSGPNRRSPYFNRCTWV